MSTKQTTVKLLSHTANPLETVYAEWLQSRTTDPVPTAAELAYDVSVERSEVGFYTERDPEGNWTLSGKPGPLESKIIETFEKVVAMRMPLGETLDFVLLLEHCPVALREQLVRHRIGHKFGDRLGADIVPDLAGSSSFWSQTTRIIDMGSFATDGEYHTPRWLEENGHQATTWRTGSLGSHYSVSELYHRQMLQIEICYRILVEAGMPLEDARNILPVAMQHRLTWKVNLSSLFHVMSRRSCWLAQLGYWEPVIEGVARELRKVHWVFGRLADPPCIDPITGEYAACAFSKENEEVIGNGNYPPCTLWVHNDSDEAAMTDPVGREHLLVNEQQQSRYRKMQQKFTKLWRRDPVTGEQLQVG